MKQEIKKNKPIELELKEIRKENKHSYFIVTLNGEEHTIGMFPFQIGQQHGERLHCYVKDIIDGKPILIQDYSYLLKERYEEGKTYTFSVREDSTQLPYPYYVIADESGIPLRLTQYNNVKLYTRQRIECTVISIKRNHIELELKEYGLQESVPFLTIAEVIQRLGNEEGIAGRWIELHLLKQPWLMEAREQYEQHNSDWIFTALFALSDHMSEWAHPHKKYAEMMLATYHKLILYLLEESDILRNMNHNERVQIQNRLSHICLDVMDYQTSFLYICDNEAQNYVEEILRKMKTSGFLFDSEKKFRIIKCLFNLDTDLLQNQIESIFGILTGKDRKNWMEEPFRTSFVEILEIYIRKSSPNADFEMNTNSEAGLKLIEKLIRALAIQLLMSTNEDNLDRSLNRTMLYRYSTFFNVSNQQKLLEKAFICLSQAKMSNFEYSWADIVDVRGLAIKLAFDNHRIEPLHYVQSFKGQTMQLRLFNDAIQILPVLNEEKAKKVLPTGLLPWHDFQVYQVDSLKNKVPASCTDLLLYQNMWNEIERTFNATPVATKSVAKKIKYRPSIGDQVTIRVTSQDKYDEDKFNCVIESDTFEGKGTIMVNDIVRYRPRPDLTYFCAEGFTKPYLFEVRVKNNNHDGTYQFEMLSLMSQQIHNFYSRGESVLCLIKDHKPGMNYYVCVDSYGFSFWVKEGNCPDLPVGSYINATVDDFHQNGNILATTDGIEPVNRFTEDEAFRKFIQSMSDERVYEPLQQVEDNEDELENAEIMMEHSSVNELIVLLDYKAVQEDDQIHTYNYLAAARLLSAMIKRNDLTRFYEERMRLLQMTHDFGINGKVDTEALLELSRKNEMLIRKYPILSNYMIKLDIMDCLNKVDKKAFLLQKLQEAKTDEVRKLADLVLANNILVSFSMHDERKAIMQKISELLKLKLEDVDSVSFGEEGQRLEFKTTAVYPPSNNMKPDTEEQAKNLMKVICGFLNTEGGTLYIGVSDYGIATGIEDDLKFFRDNKDEFDRNIRNHVRTSMGLTANSHLHSRFLNAGKKLIYELTVDPCLKPVLLDGKIILRQGSSDYAIENDEERAFFETQRPGIYEQLMQEMKSDEKIPPTESVSIIEEDDKPSVSLPEPLKVKDDTVISTSILRDNVVHDYDENYGVETVGYFHFLENNRYKLTSEGIYEEVLLSLAIHEREEKGYLIIVYESGKVARVPMNTLLDKIDNRQPLNRCNTDNPIFACPAAKTDSLLMILKDERGQLCGRVDDITRIQEDKISSDGEYINSQICKNTGVVKCEILTKELTTKLKRIHNVKDTLFGHYLNTDWVHEERELLNKIGMKV